MTLIGPDRTGRAARPLHHMSITFTLISRVVEDVRPERV
jgi:hypothetical protein